MPVERRIQRVTRWLERCLLACRAKSWENALMEMECAKAEMDLAREELWAAAQEDGNRKRIHVLAFRSTRAAFVAALLLLITAAPIANSVTIIQEQGKIAIRTAPVLEWVTTDERTLLSALRKSLSEANAGSSREMFAPSDARGDMVGNAETRVSAVDRKDRDVSGKLTERAGRESLSAKSQPVVTGEMIYSLVQLGQKALRNSEPAIRIDRSETPAGSSRRK